MKKLLALILTMMMAFTLAACSNNNNGTQKEEKTTSSSESTQTETGTSNEKNNKTQLDTANKKILVAYFSYSGNTKKVADQIHKSVGGDIFEIKTADPYPTDYNAVVDQAKKEQADNYRPKLATKVENMDSYDVIFIGYPNWWGTMPMAVFTFLEEYKLSGKTIIPFCTHDGSAFGKSVEDIKKIAPQSKILDGLEILGKSVKDENKEVPEWLRKLGMIK